MTTKKELKKEYRELVGHAAEACLQLVKGLVIITQQQEMLSTARRAMMEAIKRGDDSETGMTMVALLEAGLIKTKKMEVELEQLLKEMDRHD